MRFTGDYTARTDAKGRVFLPAAFRRVLEAGHELRLILRKDLFQHCLVLYPESVWNAQLDDLKARLNPYNGGHQMMMRQFVLGAEAVELDGNGRFLIGKGLLDFAGIASDVRFLGVDERIEVWNKDALEQLEAAGDSLGASLEAALGGAMPS